MSLGHGLTSAEAADAAVKLERFGYDFVWVSESVGSDSLPTLGAMAVRTTKVGLGTGVVNVYSRTSTQIAMAASALDSLSNGRFTLGIGSSSADVVERWHGLDYRGQLSRVGRYAEELRSNLKRREGLPRPFSALTADVPIFIAGVGEKMVALAKSKADGVLFFMRPFSDVKAKCESLASHSFRVCANVVSCVSDDPDVAESRARKTVAYYLTYGGAYARLLSRLAPPAIGEAVVAVRREWLRGKAESAAKLVPDALLGEVAIYGTPEECRSKVEEYSRVSGLHMLGLQFNPGGKDISSSLSMLSSIPKSSVPPETSNN